MVKRWYESLKIAFSMYSKIPMPKSDWTKENMRYVMCFFPWIGIVIGALFWGWFQLDSLLLNKGIILSRSFVTAIYVLIPVAVTGGIHLDGLLDTADAISSYQDRERRLEILKDSHAGAFAIITCVVYFVLSYGAYSMVNEKNILWIALGFLVSRSLSGLSIVSFPMAKGTGLAATFSDGAQKKIVKVVMVSYLAAFSVILCVFGKLVGLAVLCAAILVFVYYYKMSKKNFGGITGDLAGYFLQLSELFMALAAVLVSVLV